MKLTMDEELLRYNHYNLWNWLAKTGKKKHEAPMLNSLNRIAMDNEVSTEVSISIINDCFACGSDKSDCNDCPIKWSSVSNRCLGNNSIFRRWYYSNNTEDRKKYAAQIAKLPWRGVKP